MAGIGCWASLGRESCAGNQRGAFFSAVISLLLSRMLSDDAASRQSSLADPAYGFEMGFRGLGLGLGGGRTVQLNGYPQKACGECGQGSGGP
ncbi:hypothetical protein LX36DRAFT_656572 [Colletotrichum falcatum]|nr:hypothetical protein LX36DRAFT_656572 [Colletotrichum falcatum]